MKPWITVFGPALVSHQQAVKTGMGLHICAVSPEQLMLAHAKKGYDKG